MAYGRETEEHISQVKVISVDIFDDKALRKELKRQKNGISTALKGLHEAFGRYDAGQEILRDASRDLVSDMLALRTIKAAELIYYAYGIMGSALVTDCGLNTELRDMLSKILVDKVMPSLDHIRSALEENANELRDSPIYSHLVMLVEQVQNCMRDSQRYAHNIKDSGWKPAAAIDNAKTNFKQMTAHVARIISDFPEGIKNQVEDKRKAAAAVFAA